jgi:uncharacterized protein DUF2809
VYQRRLVPLAAAIAVGVVGYWLRFKAPISPEARDNSGGVAYVVFFVLLGGVITPAVRPSRIALTVFLITCVLEFLQLWHPGWLERIRSTFIGRCLLGTTFGWSDFPPYAIGASIGWVLLRGFDRVSHNHVS